MQYAWTPKFQLSGPTVHSYTVDQTYWINQKVNSTGPVSFESLKLHLFHKHLHGFRFYMHIYSNLKMKYQTQMYFEFLIKHEQLLSTTVTQGRN